MSENDRTRHSKDYILRNNQNDLSSSDQHLLQFSEGEQVMENVNFFGCHQVVGNPDEIDKSLFGDDQSLSLNLANENTSQYDPFHERTSCLFPEGASVIKSDMNCASGLCANSHNQHSRARSQDRRSSNFTSQTKGIRDIRKSQEMEPNQKVAADLVHLKQLLGQISHLVSHQPQISSLVNSSIMHFKGVEEFFSSLDQQQEAWREQFKRRVKKRLKQFKEDQRRQIQKVEEAKFKQQISEYELNQRVTQLEEAYQQQQLEINRQANANEDLKYEKMTLIQQHSKRMIKIENELSKIQIQCLAAIKSEHSKNKKDLGSQNPFNPSNSVKMANKDSQNSTSILGQRPMEISNIMQESREVSQKSNRDHLSQSVCFRRQRNQKQNGDDSLEINQQKSLKSKDGGDSLGTQLKNLKHMIRNFKEESDRQHKQDNQELDCNSISDIDFNPDQKKTNKFLGSRGFVVDQDENDDTADVNKAVIFQSNKNESGCGKSDGDKSVSNLGSFCHQLNNTSFFAGNNNQIEQQLPDNLDELFNQHGDKKSRGDFVEIDGTKDLNFLLDDNSDDLCVPKKDVSDMEIEELFQDSKSQKSFSREFIKKKGTRNMNQKGSKAEKDVDLDDIMRVSVATGFDEVIKADSNCKNNLQLFFSENPNLAQDKEVEEKLDLSSIDIKMQDNSNPLQSSKISQSPKGLNALNDLSAIQASVNDKSQDNFYQNGLNSEKDDILDQTIGSDQISFEALNRNLMPNLEVKVKDKIIKMPKLDIDRVVHFQDREIFKGNISDDASKSFVTEMMTDKQYTQNSNDSFQNESASKQFESKSKHPSQAQLDEDALDVLNLCDQAMSQIMDDKSSFDKQQDSIQINDLSDIIGRDLTKNTKQLKQQHETDNFNLLESLRKELQGRESDIQELKQKESKNSSHLSQSDTVPFEMRASVVKASPQVTESDFRVSHITCKPMIKESNMFTIDKIIKNQMQNASASSSKKPEEKKFQMMRLSELDSGSNHLHHASQNTGITQTQKMFLPTKSDFGEATNLTRIRAPSENHANIRKEDETRALSPEGITNGTASGNSILTQSLVGKKSRVSAPITIPACKKPLVRAQIKESFYDDVNVVQEVDDEDSKIISLNNSNIQHTSQDNDQRLGAYNSAMPQSLKNNFMSKNSTKDKSIAAISNSGSARGMTANNLTVVERGEKPQKRHQKISISRVQMHAEMSELIKSQQKSSSSVHRLKIIKKSSVSSAVAPNSELLRKNGVSIDRVSMGADSAASINDKSRFAGASNISKGDYASIGLGNESIIHNRSQVASGCGQKQKPITVSFKSIVKINSNLGQQPPIFDQKSQDDQSNCTVINKPTITKTNNSKVKIIPKQRDASHEQIGSFNISIVKSKQNQAETSATQNNNSLLKQLVKISNQAQMLNTEETQRDGSVVFIGKRKTNGEKVRHSRGASQDVGDKVMFQHREDSQDIIKVRTKASKEKVLTIGPNERVKQRKLSIGSNTGKEIIPTVQAADQSQIKKQKVTNSDRFRVQRVLVQDKKNNMSSSRNNLNNRSKPTSPLSPKRISGKIIKYDGHVSQQKDGKRSKENIKLNPQASKKNNIINIKKREAAILNDQQHQASSKGLPIKNSNQPFASVPSKRAPSVDPDTRKDDRIRYALNGSLIGRESSVDTAPDLKIKRMSKSKQPKGSVANIPQREKSQKSKLVQHDSSSFVQNVSASINEFKNDSLFIRDMQNNQNISILQDMSLLSKLNASKDQIIVVPNYNSVNLIHSQQSQSSHEASQKSLKAIQKIISTNKMNSQAHHLKQDKHGHQQQQYVHNQIPRVHLDKQQPCPNTYVQPNMLPQSTTSLQNQKQQQKQIQLQ